MFQPFPEVGQSHLKIIELVQSLTFEWADSLAMAVNKPSSTVGGAGADLHLLADVNLQACIRRDTSGCEIIDRSALLILLTTARRTLLAQNKIVTPVQAQELEAECSYILESCAIKNHRRQVVNAVGTGFEAWRRMLDMSLNKCFGYLPKDHRRICFLIFCMFFLRLLNLLLMMFRMNRLRRLGPGQGRLRCCYLNSCFLPSQCFLKIGDVKSFYSLRVVVVAVIPRNRYLRNGCI